MIYQDFTQITQTWSYLEKQSVQVVFEDPALRHWTLFGEQNPTVDTPLKQFDTGHDFGMPVGSPVRLLITEDGPCRQCPNFLRKLVLLSQTENTNILGILERFRDRGYSIHDIHSSRTCECLGLYPQRLLIELVERTAISDNIRDTSLELRSPCPYASECLRLYDQVTEFDRDEISYRNRLLLLQSEISQALAQLDTK